MKRTRPVAATCGKSKGRSINRETQAKNSQLRNRAESLRADIAVASRELYRLEALKAGLGAVGRIVKPAGAGTAAISVQISVLKQKLEQQNSNLNRVMRDIEHFKAEDARLRQARDKNADKLEQLDCITSY
ncbi:hypothetical protein [uncultured Hoeflea sp.]|uniref:hypothetical protein n=1 Tax=uncultured Hoeflea sp. TaxID=538666 RepID=UPI002638A898|nr:hypothetical protein [uncultured Hoeflea sp.]